MHCAVLRIRFTTEFKEATPSFLSVGLSGLFKNFAGGTIFIMDPRWHGNGRQVAFGGSHGRGGGGDSPGWSPPPPISILKGVMLEFIRLFP